MNLCFMSQILTSVSEMHQSFCVILMLTVVVGWDSICEWSQTYNTCKNKEQSEVSYKNNLRFKWGEQSVVYCLKPAVYHNISKYFMYF